MFYLTTHSTHFIYGYMASDIWLRTILIVRKETRCRHIGYSYRLTARVLLYAPSTDRIIHTTAFITPVVGHWLEREISQWVHPMKDQSDDPSHHERTSQYRYLEVFWHVSLGHRVTLQIVDAFSCRHLFDDLDMNLTVCVHPLHTGNYTK